MATTCPIVEYVCDTAADYNALIARLGQEIPEGYTRLDDAANLKVVFTATSQVNINE